MPKIETHTPEPKSLDIRIGITPDAHRKDWSRVTVRVDHITVFERVVQFGHSGEPLFSQDLQDVLELAAAYGNAPEPPKAEEEATS